MPKIILGGSVSDVIIFRRLTTQEGNEKLPKDRQMMAEIFLFSERKYQTLVSIFQEL